MIAVCLMALVFRGWLDTTAVVGVTMVQLGWWGRSLGWPTLSIRKLT